MRTACTKGWVGGWGTGCAHGIAAAGSYGVWGMRCCKPPTARSGPRARTLSYATPPCPPPFPSSANASFRAASLGSLLAAKKEATFASATCFSLQGGECSTKGVSGASPNAAWSRPVGCYGGKRVPTVTHAPVPQVVRVLAAGGWAQEGRGGAARPAEQASKAVAQASLRHPAAAASARRSSVGMDAPFNSVVYECIYIHKDECPSLLTLPPLPLARNAHPSTRGAGGEAAPTC